MSRNNNYLTKQNFNTLNSSTNYNRRKAIRRRLESHSNLGTSLQNNNYQNSNINPNTNINTNTSSSQIGHNHSFRTGSINLNSSVNNNSQNHFRNFQTISVNDGSLTSYRKRNINNNMFISVYKDKKDFSKKLFEIEEEKKKEENEEKKEKEESAKIEENIGSEIKDTVKCYICLDKITKPKMCPHCHRIACEKCLYNWFITLNKIKCGFCREKTSFNSMISVPFMDIVVDFVDKYFKKKTEEEKGKNILDKDFIEYCPEHVNELLYYYCLDCGKAYCKTCFVFFGEEKDKHVGHSIIEYEKYKNMSFPLLKKNKEKLEKNIEHVQENINRCLAYKKIYEHERKMGNEFIKQLQNEFNKHIDNIMNIIDEQINKLKGYINEYNKHQKELEEFYDSMKNKSYDKSCESLIIKLTKINQQKFFSSKDIKKLNDLSKEMFVNTYQSKFGQFNHDNMFLKKGLKLGNSPYEIVIDNKQRNEVHICLLLPKDKTNIKHNYQALAFIKKKGESIQSYDLDEFKEDENYIYLRKKIPWDFFGQSIFEIKGILYDFYFS